MSVDIERLIRHYFFQFTVGCDKPDCAFPLCKNCSHFSLNVPSPNRATIEAIEHARKFRGTRLCPAVSPLLCLRDLETTVNAFDRIFRSFIRNPANFENSPCRLTLSSVLSNPSFFPFILRSNSAKFGNTNLALNDDLLHEFATAMTANAPFFQPMKDGCFNAVHQIIADTSTSQTFFHIRALILAFSFSAFVGPDTFDVYILPLVRHILHQTPPVRCLFFSYLQRLPKHIRNLLLMIHNALSISITVKRDVPADAPEYMDLAQFVWTLREVSAANSDDPPAASLFSNDTYSNLIDPVKLARATKCALHNFPALLSLSLKNDTFHASVAIQQSRAGEAAVQEAIAEELLGGGGNLERVLQVGAFDLTVRRDNLIADSVAGMTAASDQVLVRHLRVTFQGEEGIDAGGVTREFFHLVLSRMFAPEFGLFRILNGKHYWFEPDVQGAADEGRLAMYRALGTLTSLGVYNHVVLPVRFPLLLYKKLLGRQIRLRDLAELEAQVAQSMRMILAMARNGEDVSDLGLTWTATVMVKETPTEVPLVEGGAELVVANENVEQYIQTYVDWSANESVRRPFEHFREGFMRLFKKERIAGFTADELDVLVSGEEVFEWDELEKNAVYDGCNAGATHVKWFWEVFREMSSEDKQRFLLFTTGSDRAPLGGLAKVVIKIARGMDPTKFPVAHTCFSQLDLPVYRSKEELAHKLLIAIRETEGFGLK
jgi:ubiquitin-protein ligase E3 A